MDLPRGIRSRGTGLEITIWKGKHRVWREFIRCDPQDPVHVRAAAKKLEDKRARYRLGLPLIEGKVGAPRLFCEVAEEYLQSVQVGKKQMHDYRKFLNQHWIPKFGNWPITDIQTSDIKKQLARMGVGIKTQKNRLVPLRGAFTQAGIDPNPAAGITWSRAQRKRESKKVLRYRPDERHQLISQLDRMKDEYAVAARQERTPTSLSNAFWSHQASYYFRFMFALGTRPGENLGIDCEDYDGQFVRIWKQRSESVEKDHTKTGEERSVYVPTWVRPYLESLKSLRKAGPLFLGINGQPLKYRGKLNQMWREAHKRAGLAYRVPYTCRHTRAAELLSQGANPAEAANQLGHSTDMFLKRYSEFIEEYRTDRDWSRFESTTPGATQIPHSGRG
ncbi:hypothetical protein BST95_08940 [Halioglobus japonicus]|uniref:Tyr recombinase domain-containing protein n=1 Tax=Halioglobus japonicus TaxID=930805 RepID=A0AAP8SN76_9GAMM|nr:tyrosine-type recombinase/integrase [Halioglobus japonicus]AQA18338.1 hypothetical protein BST95_08940 [Halioglobus japonicus]PLW86355.1 hypothetical protein C0029_07980 [Halioglobus japonicus]GHD13310.1 hypothetical protein GCM10007052_15310 [Halioglobus japonicus]